MLTVEETHKMFLDLGYNAYYSLYGKGHPINQVNSEFKIEIPEIYNNIISEFCTNFTKIRDFKNYSRMEDNWFIIENSEPAMEFFVENIIKFIKDKDLKIDMQ